MKKISRFLVTTGIILSMCSGTASVSAGSYWAEESAWEADYNVEVSAPDGGVNLRWGPGADYDKLTENMIPNGTVLHVSREATASNGNNWGLITYEEQTGWIALTQVSVTDQIPQEEKKNQIVFEYSSDGNTEYGTVTRYDDEGAVLWQYSTDTYERAQCVRVSGIGQKNGFYYLVEDGTILALNEATGEMVWKNEEYMGSSTEKGYVFDEDGNLYISGYLGPDLFVVDKEGKTLYKKDSFDPDVYWPFEMKWESENILKIHFEGGEGSDENWKSVDLNEILNIS